MNYGKMLCCLKVIVVEKLLWTAQIWTIEILFSLPVRSDQDLTADTTQKEMLCKLSDLCQFLHIRKVNVIYTAKPLKRKCHHKCNQNNYSKSYVLCNMLCVRNRPTWSHGKTWLMRSKELAINLPTRKIVTSCHEIMLNRLRFLMLFAEDLPSIMAHEFHSYLCIYIFAATQKSRNAIHWKDLLWNNFHPEIAITFHQ